MLSDGRNRYTYDDFGRLASTVTAEGDIQKNCYDAEGLRAEMEENGRLVQFLYNEDREVVAEKDYSGNIIRYIRGLGLISSDSENAKTYYHYVCDEQGSVSHIIRGEDKESGVSEQGKDQDRVLNHYEYDVFGNTISCEERVANRFRYQGEQYDPITRQYYLRARYYNPVIGRFIQEDTYYGDGLNLYEYCRNNTITYKDPTGHNICPTQRDLYHKYKEEGMSPQEAYQKMRKELGLDSKSGYKDSGVGNGNDPWRSYESGSTSKYLEQLDNLSENKINHMIDGSKNSNHGWEKLVPDKNWSDIKNIIADVMDTGVEGPYKSVFSKKATINGFEVEVTYTKLSDGTIKFQMHGYINKEGANYDGRFKKELITRKI